MSAMTISQSNFPKATGIAPEPVFNLYSPTVQFLFFAAS